MTTDHDGTVRGAREEGRPRWLRRARRRLSSYPRVGMSLRAAAAAALAWQLVHVLPFAADYPYYAPLGAVIATSTTVAGSARQSVQTIAAIALGATVALSSQQLLGQHVGTVAAVVGVGVLLGGWQRLGGGAGWLPTSALFVLLLGDQHPLAYVAGYAGLTLAGALVGLVVIAMFPPLPLTPAGHALDRLRGVLADQLEDLAAGVRRGRAPSPDEWRARVRTIDSLVSHARDAVHRVEEARRGNRIARRFRRSLERQHHEARAVQRLAFLVTSITQLLTDTSVAATDPVTLAPFLRPSVATALDRLAGVLRTVRGQEADPCAVDRAHESVRVLVAQLRRGPTTPEDDHLVVSSVVEHVRRSLRTLHPAHEPAAR